MKKICLTVIGLYVGLLSAFSQKVDTTFQNADSAKYQNRKLRLDEINLVSSYYHQDGDNSAVLGGAGSGGAGSEKLTDIANILDVKLVKYDQKNRKHSFTLEAGIDHYTSASSDQIDLKANSSASSADTRIYPSVAWSVENEKTGRGYGLNAGISSEFDYKSFGFGGNFSQLSKDKNREFGVKAQVYLDKVLLVYPAELRLNDRYEQSARNSYSASFSLSQVISKRLQLLFVADVIKQDGFLSLPFHRVYFKDITTLQRIEKLPSSRFKIPVGMRANYFLGDKIILRSFYRFYHDDWGLNAHTADLEISYKVTPFFSVAPFYRFYTQTAVDYFAPKYQHDVQDEFYTSNYDLSKFNSNFFGAGFRYAPPKGVLGIKHLNMIELRYGRYNRSTGLHSDIISLNLRVK